MTIVPPIRVSFCRTMICRRASISGCPNSPRSSVKWLSVAFGLRGHESSTLEDVGLEIGLTRERVRQIQVEGLKRLREILEKNGLSSESLFQ
ncbi:RNA polymerase sigma factor RpoS [Pseudomonas coronafaciens pv. oryzae]|nr:RNA polymerase sigma factor RpoS [Pseudomonas coronafaciens pv. oryzae]